MAVRKEAKSQSANQQTATLQTAKMTIELQQIGRRFNREWIFRGISSRFEAGQSYAILGPNGSGKSTFLQLLASSLSPSEGTIRYTFLNQEVKPDSLYHYLSLAAPYVELPEEFTLRELIDFHFRFKSYAGQFDTAEVIRLLRLPEAADKEIRYFSSGMKQRTRLALAFCAATPLLLLDEPTSNLDEQGVAWYQELVAHLGRDRLLVICSNQPHEYTFCKHHLRITDFKHSGNAGVVQME